MRVLEGTLEAHSVEFDLVIELEDKKYELWGLYEYGEGFPYDVEIEEAGNGPCVAYNSKLYDNILEIAADWISSQDVAIVNKNC